jgi:hypothetical protein
MVVRRKTWVVPASRSELITEALQRMGVAQMDEPKRRFAVQKVQESVNLFTKILPDYVSTVCVRCK